MEISNRTGKPHLAIVQDQIVGTWSRLQGLPSSCGLLRIAAVTFVEHLASDSLIFTSKVLEVQINHGTFNVAPPSYKLVYKPQ